MKIGQCWDAETFQNLGLFLKDVHLDLHLRANVSFIVCHEKTNSVAVK